VVEIYSKIPIGIFISTVFFFFLGLVQIKLPFDLIATRTFSAVCPLTARCRIVCVSHLTPIRCHWHYLGTGPAPDSSRSRPAAPSSAYFAPDRVGSWDSIRRDGDGMHAGCWAIRSASAAPSGSRAMWLNQCPTSRPYCLQRRFSGSKSLAN